jgi:hypothetical protein
MTNSRAPTPSLAYRDLSDDLNRGWVPSRDPLRLDRLTPTRLLARALGRATPDRNTGRGR